MGLTQVTAAVSNPAEREQRWESLFLVDSRSYKDGDQWKDTTSFNRDDLLVVAKLSDQAHTWVCEQEQADRQQAAA